MTRHRARTVLGLTGAALVLVVWASRHAGAWYGDWKGDNPVRRGRGLAAREGCFACHLSETGRELADPGTKFETIPSFRGGNLMMYAIDKDGIERWIREGSAGSDRTPRIPMPAFGDRLSKRQIEDLVAFVRACDGMMQPSGGSAAEGRRLVVERGCESCHGLEGSGGIRNPGSLTGTVPGWLGSDFSELVRDREEFDEWLEDGRSRRLRANRLASFFLDRSVLRMPAYAGGLSTDDRDALWSYVAWLREPRPAQERAP
ncbi:MAG: c-type cytochrome [Candidatus Eisenbacteria bacterium]